jgi:hypothetical protein
LIKETGTKEAGSWKLTLALAVGLLKAGEGLRKVPVFPQETLEQLFAGISGALHRFRVAMSYAGFLQFRAEYFVLNAKLGD